MRAVFDAINEHKVVRRTVLFITLWMTWDAYQWAASFAENTLLDGVSTGAVIAAVTAPISLLQAAVFKTYAEGRT